jgi:hypothetical protein
LIALRSDNPVRVLDGWRVSRRSNRTHVAQEMSTGYL